MIKNVVIFVLTFLITNSLTAEKVTSFAEGKALAGKLNKPLLLDFMTDW